MRSRHQAVHAVARDVLDDPSSSLDDGAVGQRDAQARQAVAHASVGERRDTLGRRRDEPADGPQLAAGLERQLLAALCEDAVELGERAARLDGDGEVGGLVLDHARDPLGRQRDAGLPRETEGAHP